MTTKRIIITVTAVVLTLAIGYCALWAFLGGGAWLSSVFGKKPPEPEIKYGEFPFAITYKIGDDEHTVNDIYVCEFVKCGYGFDIGQYREWNGYIKGTGKEAVVLYEDEERTVYCSVGSAEYYMNDDMASIGQPIEPDFYSVLKNGNTGNSSFISVEEIKELYDIVLISWSFSEPIENTYK